MAYIVTLEKEEIRIYKNVHEQVNCSIHSARDFWNWFESNGEPEVFFSSTMDFPEEYTDDSAVIELVKSIR